MTYSDDIYGSIHYRTYTIGPKFLTAGVNLDHPEKTTSHIQIIKEGGMKKKERINMNSPL